MELIQKIILESPKNNLTFENIPQTYALLRCISSTSSIEKIRFNSDVGDNYHIISETDGWGNYLVEKDIYGQTKKITKMKNQCITINKDIYESIQIDMSLYTAEYIKIF